MAQVVSICLRYVVTPVVGSVLMLLAVLKLSKRCREFFFARLFLPILSPLCAPAFEHIRKEVLQTLNEVESHDKDLRETNSLRVLEIGIGSGSNFQFIKREIQLVAVDPNTSFESNLMDNLKKYPNIHLERLVAAIGEDMHDVPSCSVDIVIITHVLCSVTDVKKVLTEAKRVLVPGGKLLFMEHVAFPEHTWVFTIQKAIDPVWEVVTCGCHLTRSSGEALKVAGFTELSMKDVYLPIVRVLQRHVYGSATKAEE